MAQIYMNTYRNTLASGSFVVYRRIPFQYYSHMPHINILDKSNAYAHEHNVIYIVHTSTIIAVYVTYISSCSLFLYEDILQSR